MVELKVPFGHDEEENIVYPVNAIKGVNYRCPSCKESLIFKSGAIKIHHFAHKPNTICNQETITHICAKLLIQKAVGDWKRGKSKAPVLK